MQNLLSSTDNYSKESLVLVQSNSKRLNVETPSCKNPCNSIYYTTFIPDKHWDCVTFNPEIRWKWHYNQITHYRNLYPNKKTMIKNKRFGLMDTICCNKFLRNYKLYNHSSYFICRYIWLIQHFHIFHNMFSFFFGENFKFGHLTDLWQWRK